MWSVSTELLRWAPDTTMEHGIDWEQYVQPQTYTCNVQLNQWRGIKAFHFVLLRQQPNPNLKKLASSLPNDMTKPLKQLCSWGEHLQQTDVFCSQMEEKLKNLRPDSGRTVTKQHGELRSSALDSMYQHTDSQCKWLNQRVWQAGS